MTRKERLFVTGLCVGASFLGGFLASIFFRGMAEAEAAPAPAVREVVSAEQFRLMDKDGRPRAVLTTSRKSSAPMFFLMDETGAPRLIMALTGSGDPSMNFLSSAKKNVIAMSTKPDGTGAFLMLGQDKSKAGSWTIVKGSDGNWYTVLKAGLVEQTMEK